MLRYIFCHHCFSYSFLSTPSKGNAIGLSWQSWNKSPDLYDCSTALLCHKIPVEMWTKWVNTYWQQWWRTCIYYLKSKSPRDNGGLNFFFFHVAQRRGWSMGMGQRNSWDLNSVWMLSLWPRASLAFQYFSDWHPINTQIIDRNNLGLDFILASEGMNPGAADSSLLTICLTAPEPQYWVLQSLSILFLKYLCSKASKWYIVPLPTFPHQ